MTIAPFLALKLRGKRDAILARQRARRVASLLSFSVPEQACIAAGTFVVACQALELFGQARLFFQIEDQHLHVFARDAKADDPAPPGATRLAGLFPDTDGKALFRLTKPLPPQECAAEQVEIGWLVKKLEETACDGLFAEIAKQNQEVLALLHELRLYRGDLGQKEEKSANPHAA